jgi:hypothetical protein
MGFVTSSLVVKAVGTIVDQEKFSPATNQNNENQLAGQSNNSEIDTS